MAEVRAMGCSAEVVSPGGVCGGGGLVHDTVVLVVTKFIINYKHEKMHLTQLRVVHPPSAAVPCPKLSVLASWLRRWRCDVLATA